MEIESKITEKGFKYHEVDELDLGQVWYEKYDLIKYKRLIGKEYYYPLYKWNNFISLSPLNLIKLKGGLSYNSKIEKYINSGIEQFKYLPPEIFIDKDIKRVGNILKQKKPLISSLNGFFIYFYEALVKDIRYLEEIHANSVIGILTGGKDSLNLLLLPWKKPIVSLSAEPNYDLVKEFCEVNNLNIKVEKLGGEENDTKERLEKDILINCNRVNLKDIRWTEELNIIKENILRTQNKDLVTITGDLADTFLTPYFKGYRSKWKNSFANKINYKLRNKTSVYLEQVWKRGAQWQGVFHSILRESTGIRNYSGYHGYHSINTLTQTDLNKVIKEDVRAEFGNFLLGRKVIYPNENPSPNSYLKRNEYSTIDYFKGVLKS